MNLDALKDEILAQLQAAGFAVFHGELGALGVENTVPWDDEAYPDYGMFLDTARKAGAIMIYFAHRKFEAEEIEEELSELAELDLSRDERRQFERRLNSFSANDGRTCTIVLAFEHGARFYTFDLVAPWYRQFIGLCEEITDSAPDEDDSDSVGPYFSKN